MIHRQLQFEVLWKEGNAYKRERVKTIDIDKDGAVGAVTDSGMSVMIDWLNTFLLQFTTCFDKLGGGIFHGDILKGDDGKVYEVSCYYGAFWLQCGEDTVDLTDERCMALTLIGDVIQNPEFLLSDAEAEILLKQKIGSEMKKPPVVKLKGLR